MPQGVPNNPPVNASSVNVSTGAKDYMYATVAAPLEGYAKLAVISKQVRKNALTGAIIGIDWYNEDTGLVLLTPTPTLLNFSEIPADGLLDNGDNVVTSIDATAGGTALNALPAGTNYVSLFISQDQPDGVNYSTSATAPVTGLANGQLEIQPNGNAGTVSAADLAALKLIAKSAVTVKVTAVPFYKFPQYN
jgi:hypothetical protein